MGDPLLWNHNPMDFLQVKGEPRPARVYEVNLRINENINLNSLGEALRRAFKVDISTWDEIEYDTRVFAVTHKGVIIYKLQLSRVAIIESDQFALDKIERSARDAGAAYVRKLARSMNWDKYFDHWSDFDWVYGLFRHNIISVEEAKEIYGSTPPSDRSSE